MLFSSTTGPSRLVSDALRRDRLVSDGRLDNEVPLRDSEGEKSEEAAELSVEWCSVSSSPNARAKFDTEIPPSLASEFFLRVLSSYDWPPG